VSSDEADFRHVYEQAFPVVYRVAYRFSGRRETAEDAVQEAFARAFERWGRLRGEPWIVGWIVTTTLNILRRTGRRTAELCYEVEGLHSPKPNPRVLWICGERSRSSPSGRRRRWSSTTSSICPLPRSRR
jgi:RNA polymerase sigma-70 factor (ECF subfamily)